tara:strand:+ start:104 stop:364 length:261 start_codon:yes stop_codon:yes gene_type:complete
MVDFPFTGKHNAGNFTKRAATADDSKNHSGQMLISSEFFGVSVAVVLFGCPINIFGQNEIQDLLDNGLTAKIFTFVHISILGKIKI